MFKKGFEFFEGHGEPVMEVGGGEDAGIEGAIVHDADVGEAGLEVLIGHRAWILKLAEDGIVKATEIAVWDKFLEHVLAGIGDIMDGSRKPGKDIGFAVVCDITIEVVTLAGSYGTFFRDECRTRSIESKSTKNMAFTIIEITHGRTSVTMTILRVAMMWIIIRLLFCSEPAYEAQVRFVRIEDFEADILSRGDLIKAVLNKPFFGFGLAFWGGSIK